MPRDTLTGISKITGAEPRKGTAVSLVPQVTSIEQAKIVISKQTKVNMNHQKTMVSRTINSLTLQWAVPAGVIGTDSVLSFENSIGNARSTGAIPAGAIPATVVGSFDASMLRTMLQTFVGKVVQMNYECKQDASQLNEPIELIESMGRSASNIFFHETAGDRRNSENIDTLQTIYQGYDMNVFNSLKINAPQTGVAKTVSLTLKFESWNPYGALTTGVTTAN